MKVKRYEGPSIEDVLLQIKSDLGREAVILHSKKFIKGGLFGFFGKECIEVLAAKDIDEKAMAPEKDVLIAKKSEAALNELENHIKEVKTAVNILVQESISRSDDLKHLPKIFGYLAEHDCIKEVLDTMVEDFGRDGNGRASEPQREMMARMIASHIKTSGPIVIKKNRCKTVALIGPTGVGKTTTIAKLAANFVLKEKKKVALITADIYRIAAVEQLKTYAGIIGIPVEVVFSQLELQAAIKRQTDKDLILIDTAGRSQSNDAHVQELKNLFDSMPPDETHLVMSLTTKFRDLLDIYECFSIAGIDRLLLTKLDETKTYGNILNLSVCVEKPISYITNGQSVPEDIELADPIEMAETILSGYK